MVPPCSSRTHAWPNFVIRMRLTVTRPRAGRSYDAGMSPPPDPRHDPPGDARRRPGPRSPAHRRLGGRLHRVDGPVVPRRPPRGRRGADPALARDPDRGPRHGAGRGRGGPGRVRRCRSGARPRPGPGAGAVRPVRAGRVVGRGRRPRPAQRRRSATGRRTCGCWPATAARSRSTNGRASASTAPRTSRTRACTSGWCGPGPDPPTGPPRPVLPTRPHRPPPAGAAMIAVTGSTGALGGLRHPRPRRRPRRPAPPRGARPRPRAEGRRRGGGLRVRRRGGRRRRAPGRDDAADGLGRRVRDRREQHRTFIRAAADAGRAARRLHLVRRRRRRTRPSRSGATTATPSRRSARAGWTFTLLRDNFYADVLPLLRRRDGRDPRAGRRRAGSRRWPAPTWRTSRRPCCATRRRTPARPTTLTGPEALTMAEVAARAGAVLGRELRFEDETVEEAYASRARGVRRRATGSSTPGSAPTPRSPTAPCPGHRRRAARDRSPRPHAGAGAGLTAIADCPRRGSTPAVPGLDRLGIGTPESAGPDCTVRQ